MDATTHGQSPDPAARADERSQIDPTTATMRENVVQMLRDSIVSAELLPGQRVAERSLRTATGASRASVREALSQLEADRLLTPGPQDTPVVSVISPDEARCLYETRAVLEALAARTCAERATDSEIETIAEATEALRRSPEQGDLTTVWSAADDLFRLVFAGAHNPVLESMLRALHVRVTALAPTTLSEPGRPEQMVVEVAAWACAVVRRDAEAAELLAFSHVMKAGRHAVKRLTAAVGADNL